MAEVKYTERGVHVQQCFSYIGGNSGLTKKLIHHNPPRDEICVVISSSLLDETSMGVINPNAILPGGKKLKLFKDREGIVISRKGRSGEMSYLPKGLYATNDDAYIIFLNDSCPFEIDLEWFILKYQNEIQSKFVTTSAGNQTWSITKFFSSFKFDIPDIDTQKDIAKKLSSLKFKREKLLEKEEYLKTRTIITADLNYKYKNIPIADCFDYMSGNSGLSVKTIHNQKIEGDNCVVLSSSLMNETNLGYINENAKLPNGKKLRVFKNKEGIVISRNGNAGSMSYLKPGSYTLTDHAYIIYLKDNCPFDIDLRWFSLNFSNKMKKIALTTTSGNQTWSIQKCFENFTFDIPSIEDQRIQAEKIIKIKQTINNICEKIDELVSIYPS